ncbi:MAG: TIGR00730 family Rossman fold protein [Muribaculaceae bacterium]
MESNNRYICIYGASSGQIADVYKQAAYNLAAALAADGWNCINGAGSTGVMRAASDGFLDAGQRAVGIIPQFMVDNGWHYSRLSQIIATPDMHQRKQLMAEKSECAIALPGGCGTLEELTEIITWKQLGLYDKPIIIYNVKHFFDHLIMQLQHCISEQFMKPSHSMLWHVACEPHEVTEFLRNYNPNTQHKVESKI